MAWTCVFSKQSLPPALCGHTTLHPQRGFTRPAPLLPKLRGQFAEFLNHSSPDRLGILYLTTCVGLGYGPLGTSLEAFLGSIGSLTSPESARHHVSATCTTDLPMVRPTRLPQDNHRLGPATFLRHPITKLLPPKILAATLSIRRPPALWAVSTGRFVLGAPTRVREYQPVIHRLRLSASP